MKAPEILNAAAGHMQDRASTYDKPEGERSMGRAVAALNAITGRDLTEAEGWLLLQILKSVRLFTRPGFHRDSAEDAVAYAALMGEAKSAEAIDRALQVAGQAADLLAGCRDAAEKFLAGASIDSGPMWIEWHGGNQPVLDGVIVEVRLRDGSTHVEPAHDLRWNHNGMECDIVAWREPWPEDQQRVDLEPAVLANVEAFNAGSVELWAEDDERRMDVVAQNGNDGAAYAGKGPCLGCGGPHPLHRCGRGHPTGEDESL